MKLTRDEFTRNKAKPITLLGMSGVGKTYISSMLAQHQYPCYSCDFEIGTRFLSENIRRTLGIQVAITRENLSELSRFVGQLGSEEQGGLPLTEFKKRQMLYYEAECASLRAAIKMTDDYSEKSLVIDSTGSLCEIEDYNLIKDLGEKTLFVYLQASHADEQELIRRAQVYPKPLFFPPSQFDQWLEEYRQNTGIKNVSEMLPNDFSCWVFSKLLYSRLPKYQSLADRFGITIPSAALTNLKTPDDFFSIVAEFLP